MKTKVLLTLCLVWFCVSGIIAFTVTASVVLGNQFDSVESGTLNTLVNLTIVFCIAGTGISCLLMQKLMKEKVKSNEKELENPIQVPVHEPGADD
jgi:flagellar motor component MotA